MYAITAVAVLSLLVPLAAAADGTETLPTPEWAIPKEGPESVDKPEGKVTLPGSELALTQQQIDDPFNTPDWYPDEHERMPAIVKHGREPDNWACAMCHLASGNGHPQSARLTGNSAEYLLRQLQAFKGGDRSSYLGAFIDDLHKIENRSDAVSAAEWFASLSPRRHQKVIETETVPRTTFDGRAFMRIVARSPGGNVETEPLDGRIIEVPEDYAAVKARSPWATFLTYVPTGSVEAGEDIAMEGVRGVAPCVSCHGPELRGTALGPALAGAFPTYVVRQLYDFRNGKRRGLADQTGYMSSSSRLLTAEEIVNVAAYIGSLPVSASEVQRQGELPFAVAERIAGAFYACAQRKQKPRSIHIIDRFGNTVYAGRMDGQIADNVDVALLKATAALYVRGSTRPWLERAEEDPLQAMWIAQLGQFMSPVGLPILIDGRLMGAVGIGGASGDCAREALSIVLGQNSVQEPQS